MRIALIHALEESVAPSHAAFASAWPDAYTFDLLDTSLSDDRASAGTLEPQMLRRINQLACYAASTSGKSGTTRGILFTCSAFGPAIDAAKAKVPVPVLRPNESAFRHALSLGTSITIMVTFPPSADALKHELREMAASYGKTPKIQIVVVEDALAALKRGDLDNHDRLAAEAAGRLTSDCDCLVLGQFSLARAKSSIARSGFSIPIITTPDAAVAELQSLIQIQDRRFT
jgi:Asp/Glu/hydantoin racemase